jgi:predicted glycoside hydrolase/deacetylase ChbG (UPF0249 family)
MNRILLVVSLLLMVSLPAVGQVGSRSAGEQSKTTLIERLGYPHDTKLLIIHADDLGMTHSVNAASIKALASGAVNSASLMVPCPWFAEIAAYARSHPEADLGLHLTLTSEWKAYRWGPVLSGDRVRTLLDRDGYLHSTEREAAAKSDVREVEAEIRTQITRAKGFGIEPTHLDSHMVALYQNRAFFEALLRVGRDNGLPVMVSREWFDRAPYLPTLLEPRDIVIDRIIGIEPAVQRENWEDFYIRAIRSIRPGVTQLIVHLAYADEEMRAATLDQLDWGAEWRQRDFDFFTSAKFRQVLRESNVKLITWRELGKARAAPTD